MVNNADKYIRFCSDAYLFVEVYGCFRGLETNDIILLKRENKICKYKIHCIKYFTPHSEEFFGKLLWVGFNN
jgi:hypothetical protein